MKLYNTASRKLEEFTPQNPKEVKLYTCGPTVYSFAHIGNLTSYIYWDLLVRALRQNGWGVKRVMNLTDVGHLVSDALLLLLLLLLLSFLLPLSLLSTYLLELSLLLWP